MIQDAHGKKGASLAGVGDRPTPNKRLLTVEETAEYLGIAEQTVRNWASTGKLPKVRVHGCLRFDVRALDAWIAERSEPVRK